MLADIPAPWILWDINCGKIHIFRHLTLASPGPRARCGPLRTCPSLRLQAHGGAMEQLTHGTLELWRFYGDLSNKKIQQMMI